MKYKWIFTAVAGFLILFTTAAADRLAIAEPINKGGLKTEETDALWGMLEASVDGGYELISRAALKTMMTEIGLVTSSDLVNLNSAQKARLGEVKTVEYLLVPTVGKFGTRLNLTLVVVNASTGEIDPARKSSETFASLDDLADKLKDMLREAGLGQAEKKRGISALLIPIIQVPLAPGYLGHDFNVRLEESLLAAGVRLRNLQSVAKILETNKIANLYEVEPAMFVRIGELLRVDSLMQATITRFSCTFKKEYLKASKRTVVRVLGNIEGDIRIISAQTGEVTGSIPFRQKVDFDDLDSSETEDWSADDYGKYLIEKILPEISKEVIAKVK